MHKHNTVPVAVILHYDRIEDYDGRGNRGKFAATISDREHVLETFLPTINGWKYRDQVEVVEEPHELARIFHDRGLGLADFDAKVDGRAGPDFAKDAREELARLQPTA